MQRRKVDSVEPVSRWTLFWRAKSKSLLKPRIVHPKRDVQVLEFEPERL